MTDNRRVMLEDTTARWATAQGYITAMSLQHNDRNYTAVFLTRDELQAIVSAAAGQYGIYPTCNCYPHGHTPDTYEGPKDDCPIHGANRRCNICGTTFANHNGYECIGDWFA